MDKDEITLRQYIDMRMESAEKAVAAALAAADRAVNKAETASEKRFESMNEFRGALNDSARLLMPRSEAEQSFRILADKTDELNKRLTAREQQGQGLSQGWLILVSVISVVCSLGLLIYTVTRPHL